MTYPTQKDIELFEAQLNKKDDKDTNYSEDSITINSKIIKKIRILSMSKNIDLIFDNDVFKDFKDYTVSTTGNTLTNIDDSFQFILFHEGMHLGYVMALFRALKN